jgi:hypothetical protein
MRKIDVKQLAVRFIGGSDTPYDATYINFEDETVEFKVDGQYVSHPVTARFDEVEFFEKPKPVEVRFKVRGKFTGVEEEWDLKQFQFKSKFIQTCKDSIGRVMYEELEHAPLDNMTIMQLSDMDDVDDLMWITVVNQSELGESLWEFASKLLEEKVKAIIEEKLKAPKLYSITMISHNCRAECQMDFTRDEMKEVRKQARGFIRNDIKTKKRLHKSFGTDHGEIEMACSEPGVQKMIHDYYNEYHHRHFVKGEE